MLPEIETGKFLLLVNCNYNQNNIILRTITNMKVKLFFKNKKCWKLQSSLNENCLLQLIMTNMSNILVRNTDHATSAATGHILFYTYDGSLSMIIMLSNCAQIV